MAPLPRQALRFPGGTRHGVQLPRLRKRRARSVVLAELLEGAAQLIVRGRIRHIEGDGTPELIDRAEQVASVELSRSHGCPDTGLLLER